MTMIALLFGLLAVQDQPAPSTRFADGQDARICGTVVSYRPAGGCSATLHLSDKEERFEVFIPASVRPSLSIHPHQMIGADLCASGRIRLVPLRVILDVSMARNIEIIKPPAGVPFGGDARSFCERGLHAPEVLSEHKPAYTSAAMRARVEGTVEMEAVVGPEGFVTAVRILKGLHPELDESAIDALKQWKFKPGTLDGKPVPVLVVVEMTFTLRK
jgi:TonB family protein